MGYLRKFKKNPKNYLMTFRLMNNGTFFQKEQFCYVYNHQKMLLKYFLLLKKKMKT